MTILSDSVLVESKSARDNQLVHMPHERAQQILSQVKTLYFALWKGVGTATTEQLAEFYEVPVGTIRPLIKPYKDEFSADGVKTLRSKALKDARCVIQLPSETSQALIWTPRATLRLGMILRESAVAKAVRTSLLDAAEHVIPAQSQEIKRLELELQLIQAKQRYQDSAQGIIVSTSLAMLAYLRGDGPTPVQIQYRERFISAPSTNLGKIGQPSTTQAFPRAPRDIPNKAAQFYLSSLDPPQVVKSAVLLGDRLPS